MLDDIVTIVRKEFKEIIQTSAKSKSAGVMRMAIPVVVVGVLLPWRIGGLYLSSLAPLMGIGWILPMVSIGLTVDAFAGERERRTLETLLASRLSDEAILLGKLAASVLYAWALLMASLVLSVVTINLTHPTGTLQMFSLKYAVVLLVVCFLLSLFVCSVAVLVSLRASTVRQASQTLALAMMAVYFSAIFGIQALPRSTRGALLQLPAGGSFLRAGLAAAVVLAVLDVILLGAAKARFRRARLILD